VKDEEIWWEGKSNPSKSPEVVPRDSKKTNDASSAWDSSRSAVLGLASGYNFNIYEQFVGSLRATGYSGHIILGVKTNLPNETVQYFKEQNVRRIEIGKYTYYTPFF